MATDRGVTVIAQQGDMVDLMVWRHYGRQDGRRVEQVLDHPNNYDLPDPGWPRKVEFGIELVHCG